MDTQFERGVAFGEDKCSNFLKTCNISVLFSIIVEQPLGSASTEPEHLNCS